MQLKTLIFALGPPTLAIGAVAAYNPDALTWPTVIVLVVGVSGAVVQHLLKD